MAANPLAESVAVSRLAAALAEEGQDAAVALARETADRAAGSLGSVRMALFGACDWGVLGRERYGRLIERKRLLW
jgi:hypothetical protein